MKSEHRVNQVFVHFSFSLSKRRKTALKEANSEKNSLCGNRTQSIEPGQETDKQMAVTKTTKDDSHKQ
jgi:hypothetical protein